MTHPAFICHDTIKYIFFFRVDAEVEDELSSSCSEDSDDDSKSKNSPAENLCSHDGSESNNYKILQLDNDKTGEESSSANCTELKEQDTEIPNK